MTPTHALSVSAPRSALPPARVRRGAPRSAALPSLTRRAAPSVTSGLILVLIALALLLQASFFVGLASGQLAGPEPRLATAQATLAR